VSVKADFVGSAQCGQCHAAEHRAWEGSQHQLAMQHVGDKTVLGDFNDATFRHASVQSKFFRKDGRFLVRTDGPDGKLQDFEVKYVFGLAPLQQYLIELPGGRLQALSIAWDTRPKGNDGQRWFHLYPGHNIKPGDPLHWTGLQQNWNFMCADCHSTNVRKNYDASARTFHTTWSEISVGCESCHGPGSAHVSWAKKQDGWQQLANKGLTVALDERRDVRWVLDAASGNSTRSPPLASTKEIEVCARCHGRRAQLTDTVKAGDPLADGFQMALLEPGLYHVDGQMRDEVYNYGSFMQSKMHAKGVTCSDCHHPHTQKLRAPGNSVCTQCHSAQKYDASQHHFHPKGTPSAACSACHMPTVTYMLIDPRHDHSFRVPRPDLSEKLKVPNACNACHADKSAHWAAAEIEKRLGPERKGYQRFAETFHAADLMSAGSAGNLIALIEDASQPAIVRASAIERLGQQPGAPRIDTLTRALNDVDPLVREAAVAALTQADPAARIQYLPRMLGDSARTVRIAAARPLAGLSADQIPSEHRDAFKRALEEYVGVQRYNGDRPEAQTALGSLRAQQGDWDQAVSAFEAAIELDPTFVAAYVNWADALRERGQESEAERVLREGLKANGRVGALHHALGLSLVRQRRLPEGLAELALAAKLAPEWSRYGYVYGVALHDSGRQADAIRVLRATLARHPNDPQTLFALATYERDAAHIAKAREYAERLVRIDPSDENARRLLQALRGRR
jgi:tetratricopeptide (TPR) repeat protein